MHKQTMWTATTLIVVVLGLSLAAEASPEGGAAGPAELEGLLRNLRYERYERYLRDQAALPPYLAAPPPYLAAPLKRNSEIINSLLALPKSMSEAGR